MSNASVDNVWSDFARTYDAIVPLMRGYQRMLSKILRDTAEGKLIIDAGCGTGLVTEALLARGQDVFGFDNNPGMFARCIDRIAALPADQQARCKLVPGDVQQFPPGCPKNANGVVLNNVLFYVKDAKKALEECFAHLADGAVVIATGPRPNPDYGKILGGSIEEWKAEGKYNDELEKTIAHHSSLIRQIMKDPTEMVSFFEPDQLVELLKSVGFKTVIAAEAVDYFGQNFYVSMRK